MKFKAEQIARMQQNGSNQISARCPDNFVLAPYDAKDEMSGRNAMQSAPINTITPVYASSEGGSRYRIVPHSANLLPSPFSLLAFLLKIFQNRSVSSPAPVTTV